MAKKKRSRHSLRTSIFYFLLLTVFLFFGHSFHEQYKYFNNVDHDYKIAKQRMEAARRENDDLKAEKASLENLSHIEKVAREELNMVRQGEIPYIVPRR